MLSLTFAAAKSSNETNRKLIMSIHAIRRNKRAVKR